MSSETKRTFPALNATNWGQWADNMEAYLSTKELWEYVDGSTPKPAPADPAKPTAEEIKQLAYWKRKSTKASGEIWLALEDNQKSHVKEVKSDPVQIWTKLEGVHLQKKPGACFNAYDNLFNICKEENESLSALMARADKALQDIKALHPTNFTLEVLDNELLCMTLIHALPAEYNNFASSLLLLDSLDIDKLKSAFQSEESQHLACNITSSTSLAFQSSLTCLFCSGSTHLEKDCFAKQKASADAKEKRKEQWKGKGKSKKQAAKEASEQTEQANASQIEFAGYASAPSSSTHPQWLQSQACADWNTDTGATSHMTPHKHWFHSYSPHVVPIRLANTLSQINLTKMELQSMPMKNLLLVPLLSWFRLNSLPPSGLMLS
jgi:hypothetical protein